MLSFSEVEINTEWTIGELVTIIFWHGFLKIFGPTDTLKDFILLNIQIVRGLVQSEVINILDVVKETKRLSLFIFTYNVTFIYLQKYKDNHFIWANTWHHTVCFIAQHNIRCLQSQSSVVTIEYFCLMTINLEKHTKKKKLRIWKGKAGLDRGSQLHYNTIT